MAKIDLSIIMGAYQEAPIITSSLEKLAGYLETHDHGVVELVVVTADSPDGTAELVRAQAHRFKHFRLLEPGPRVGKGRDIRLGMLAAQGRYRLFMDADLATPLNYLQQVDRQIASGAKVAIAVRDLLAIHTEWKRKILTGGGNLLSRVILLPGIRDTQCGFKLFEAGAAQAIFERVTITGWGFDLEALAIARYLGYYIETFYVSDWHDPKAAAAGLAGDSAHGAALQTLHDLLQIRWNLWRGRYRR